MEGIYIGITVGVGVFVITGLIGLVCKIIKTCRNKRTQQCQQTAANSEDIENLKNESSETKELVKLTLGMCILLGDGMIQSGVNGDVKKQFARQKQEALKFL
jgi:predicted histidine transporter YuiF (NhaC family)